MAVDKERHPKMEPLDEVVEDSRCVISVMGAHAGEDVAAIFNRKALDIAQVGMTFWLMRSPKARPCQVQEMCRTAPTHVIFIEPATKGGARPTSARDTAREYSENGEDWYPLPHGLSPVTGKLDGGATALIFDMLTTSVDGNLDLWEYADFRDEEKPVRFIIGCSTVCAIRKDMKLYPEKTKSRYRKVVALARLVKPYCVWLH